MLALVLPDSVRTKLSPAWMSTGVCCLHLSWCRRRCCSGPSSAISPATASSASATFDSAAVWPSSLARGVLSLKSFSFKLVIAQIYDKSKPPGWWRQHDWIRIPKTWSSNLVTVPWLNVRGPPKKTISWINCEKPKMSSPIVPGLVFCFGWVLQKAWSTFFFSLSHPKCHFFSFLQHPPIFIKVSQIRKNVPQIAKWGFWGSE